MEKVNITRNLAHLRSLDFFYFDTQTNGPAVLCLHGRWGRAETWCDFIQHYGSRYRIIAPDQRGHGLSGKPVSTYSAEEMAGDMVNLLEHLKIDSCLVVGHSMGGRIAGFLAAGHPQLVKAVAILDKSASGAAGPDVSPLDQIPAVDPLTQDWPLPFSTLHEAREYIRREMESDLSCEYFINSLVEDVDGIRMMFSAQAMAANIAHDRSWFHLLPAIQCPRLLVRSSSHSAVPDEDFEKMQSLLKCCLAREVSHPDHNVHLSCPGEFYSFFDEFLTLAGYFPSFSAR